MFLGVKSASCVAMAVDEVVVAFYAAFIFKLSISFDRRMRLNAACAKSRYYG